MTQLIRAAAPSVVPGAFAGGRRTKALPHAWARRRLTACLARTTSLLAIAGLAGCADALTDASAPLSAPRLAVSGSEFEQTYSIPIPENSLHGTSTVGWRSTGITVPRAGKYRIRVQGFVTASQHPLFPGPCPAVVPAAYAGDWGPMGRPELGTHLRVAFYTRAAEDWGFPWTVVDERTIETEQRLEANTEIWVARQGLGLQLMCSAHPSPIPVFAFSGSQILTVTEIPEPRLECKGADGSTEIERAQTVRCAITPDKPYKVLGRRAAGERFTIAARPDSSHAADVPYVWEGPAVADTRVSVVLELTNDDGSTEQKTYTADFKAKARDWPKLTVSAPIVTHDVRDDMAEYPNGVWGNFGADMNQTTMNAVRVVSAPSGPNTGLMYMPDPWPAVESTIYLHPAMYNETALGQEWYKDQNGEGSGTCTPALFGIMVPFAERHEGVTQLPNSHWGITHRMYQDNDYEQRLEKVYRQTTKASEVRQAAYDVFVEFHVNEITPQQDAFDDVEYPAFEAIMGCGIDYNRNNP
jgi:hypothetical protein